jgi:hypothetical protein
MPPPLENIDDKANFEGVVMLQWTWFFIDYSI